MIDLSTHPNASWTTRELRAWIRRATQDLNREFYEIKVNGVDIEQDYPLLYQQRNKLLQLGTRTGKEFRGGIGLGLTYKTKMELVKQARALRETYNVMEGQQRGHDDNKQAYKTFISNHPGFKLSYDEYLDMTETLGSMGTHLLDEYGNSDDFVDMYDEARDQNKSDKDITKAIVETNRESKGKGWTTEKMMDELRQLIGLNE